MNAPTLYTRVRYQDADNILIHGNLIGLNNSVNESFVNLSTAADTSTNFETEFCFLYFVFYTEP